MIPIVALSAEGGDLHHTLLRDNAHGAVLQSGQHQRMVGEKIPDRFRFCGGAKVIIMGGQPQQRIPDAATHRVGSKAGLFQTVQAGPHIFRQPHPNRPFRAGGMGRRLQRSVIIHRPLARKKKGCSLPGSARQQKYTAARWKMI